MASLRSLFKVKRPAFPAQCLCFGKSCSGPFNAYGTAPSRHAIGGASPFLVKALNGKKCRATAGWEVFRMFSSALRGPGLLRQVAGGAALRQPLCTLQPVSLHLPRGAELVRLPKQFAVAAQLAFAFHLEGTLEHHVSAVPIAWCFRALNCHGPDALSAFRLASVCLRVCIFSHCLRLLDGNAIGEFTRDQQVCQGLPKTKANKASLPPQPQQAYDVSKKTHILSSRVERPTFTGWQTQCCIFGKLI